MRRLVRVCICCVVVLLVCFIIAFAHYSDEDFVSDKVLEYLYSNENVFSDEDLNKEFVSYEFNVKDYKGLFIDYSDKDFSVSIDKKGLKKYLKKVNKKRNSPVNASIYLDNGNYKINKGSKGNKIDIKGLCKSLSVDSRRVDIEEYKVKQSVSAKDLKLTCESANRYINWVCEYDKDGILIKSGVNAVTISEDNNVIVNSDWIENAVKEVASEYNTVGGDWDFKTTSGSSITVSGGTWGTEVDVENEVEAIIGLFNNGENVYNRTPIFTNNYEEINGDYIEVDKTKQHLWVYKDGSLLMETDVVTGTKGKHDTPVGVYFISERIRGKYLTGEGYRTWVDRWMRLTNNGIGLHDANRRSFGGDIYLRSGSHGCINLPYSFAIKLFDEVYRGYPVIIY